MSEPTSAKLPSAAGLGCGCSMWNGVWSYCAFHTAHRAGAQAFSPSGQRPSGWQCPACGAVYAPWVYCCQQAHPRPATGANEPQGAAGPCCHRCTPNYQFMLVCPNCGNKRCPRANDHDNACTGSNEPGQPGSAY